MKKARSLGISIISMEEAEIYVENNQGDIDLIVSYLFWRKICKSLIVNPRYGCINFHPAILPKWRGSAGYNIVILNKLNELGATAYYVDEEIDTGAIIRDYKFNFDYRLEIAQSLERKKQSIQMELYKSVILDVSEKGILASVPQNKEDGVYISKREMIEMMKINLNNIENEDLDLKIRACWFPPYNGAGFEVNGKFYTLINDEILKTL